MWEQFLRIINIRKTAQDTMEQRYVAAMVLSGVGDAMGFRNGVWEFCHDGATIHEELHDLGGVANLNIQLPDWPISDDTVMHIATAEALVLVGNERIKNIMYAAIARKYIQCVSDMRGRAAGITCMNSVRQLKPEVAGGLRIPFNRGGGGCGAAMRAMCIGLRYPYAVDETDLIAVSIEAGRLTHHHPTGYLGSMAAALFTAYAVRGKPLLEWGRGLLETLPIALEYINKSGDYFVLENEETWHYFQDKWTQYVKDRNIADGESEPEFPKSYSVAERDKFYDSVSYDGYGGASGHDAPMIAYDALLGSKGDWEKLCKRAMLHGGNSDSTGVIAGAWYGAMFGFYGVPECNYRYLEYRKRLEKMGVKLYRLGGAGVAALGQASASEPVRPMDLSGDDIYRPTGRMSAAENDAMVMDSQIKSLTEKLHAERQKSENLLKSIEAWNKTCDELRAELDQLNDDHTQVVNTTSPTETQGKVNFLSNLLERSYELCLVESGDPFKHVLSQHVSSIVYGVDQLEFTVPEIKKVAKRDTSDDHQHYESTSSLETNAGKDVTIEDSEQGCDTPGEKVRIGVSDESRKVHTYLYKHVIMAAADSVNKKLQRVIAQEFQLDYTKQACIQTFVSKCLEVSWLMVMQTPTVHINFDSRSGEKLEREKYEAFTVMGKTIDYIVWPCVYLHEGGPLLTKGIAQGLKL